MAEAGPWQDFQHQDTSSGPWEDYAQPQTQPQQVSDSPSLYEALKANIQPFIQHPFRSIYETVVPTPQDIRNIWALTKPETYQQTTQPGSQEWLNQVVGYGIPVATLGAAKFVGGLRGAPEAAPEAAPAAADVVAPEVRPAAPAPEPAPAPETVAPETAQVQPPAEAPAAPEPSFFDEYKVSKGDTFNIGGEDYTVKNFNPDSESVWLENKDGTPFAAKLFPLLRDFEKTKSVMGEHAQQIAEAVRTGQPDLPPEPPPAEPVPQPEQPVQHGEFGKEGYTAVPTAEEPQVSAIRNESVQQKVAAGQLGEIAPGQGYSTRAMTDAGLQMPPEEVNQHISDLVQGNGGDPIKQAMAVRAEAARLEDRSNQLSRIAQDNPSDAAAQQAAEEAYRFATEFYKGPVAKIKEIFHATGMSMQGELPIDLSSYNGQRLNWVKMTGKEPPPSAEAAMRKSARDVSRAQTDEQGAMQNLGQAIDRATANRKLPNAEEVRANIRERMGLQPCKV